VHWVETRDWEKAFHAVIPKRKFLVGGKGGGTNGVKEGEGEEGEEGEDIGGETTDGVNVEPS